MIKFSSSLKLNKIHMVDSLFKEDPKNIISPGRPNFEGGTAGKNLWKMGNNRDIYCIYTYMQIGDGQFRKRKSAPTPW